jgi:hypothetical protein
LAAIFRNPELTDYFQAAAGVRAGADPRSLPAITEAYEAAKVIHFPELKLDIDFDFWAGLPTDGAPAYRKLSLRGEELRISKRAREAGADPVLVGAIQRQVDALLRQVLPVYEAMFRPYRFVERQSVVRVDTIMNSDMHIDTYDVEFPNHFARLFINLDSQPRIWQTSYAIDEIFARFGRDIPAEDYARLSNVELWQAFRRAAFTGDPRKWWDGRPRHVVYFQPGDVWAVDSRQVAHQIFYGRRAISIDFTVEVGSMLDPGRHYLSILDRFRRERTGKAVGLTAGAA